MWAQRVCCQSRSDSVWCGSVFWCSFVDLRQRKEKCGQMPCFYWCTIKLLQRMDLWFWRHSATMLWLPFLFILFPDKARIKKQNKTEPPKQVKTVSRFDRVHCRLSHWLCSCHCSSRQPLPCLDAGGYTKAEWGWEDAGSSPCSCWYSWIFGKFHSRFWRIACVLNSWCVVLCYFCSALVTDVQRIVFCTKKSTYVMYWKVITASGSFLHCNYSWNRCNG